VRTRDHHTNGRPAGELAEAAWTRLTSIDRRVVGVLDRVATAALRLSLGTVFVWFGALKVGDVSPVADLVASTVYWVEPSWFVPALGAFEILVGLGLIAGRGMRGVLALFAAQMLGTLLVLVVRSDVAFQGGNVLLLTTEGEFVVKNLVLLSAGLAVGARLRAPRPWARPPAAEPAAHS
jgi:putative oxidoreductase